VALKDLRFAAEGGADDCRRLSVGVTGEIFGVGQAQRWEEATGSLGHELSSPIDGRGHSRGWQPGSKVSMMIIRPPQQGQVFHSSCSSACPPSVPSLWGLDEAAE